MGRQMGNHITKAKNKKIEAHPPHSKEKQWMEAPREAEEVIFFGQNARGRRYRSLMSAVLQGFSTISWFPTNYGMHSTRRGESTHPRQRR
jgi:hypothetical protein